MKGVQGIENKYCIWYQNRWHEGGSWITYETKHEEQFWKTEMYRRVRFRSCGTVGYGPTIWVKSRKGANICRVIIARQVRVSHVSYVDNNIGTKGEGWREPFSCSQGVADQKAKFSSIGGYQNVINNSNKVLLTENVHRGVYISKELSQLR